ncbi:MarR family transcriptional regulator [Winogradskyella sp.]|uniref:MarR family winged helix-turn-helix transcriptional regulator n=1 Tax=Winogradskyella sp. TaxID=1883156 RepID=UPI0026130E89|nr:MarR family transcriptional regulator [Winogradskyella sp.]
MELPLEIEIGRTSTRFFWSFQNKLNSLLKPFGLTIEQWRLLMLISYNEGTDQQFLADETLKVKSAITSLLTKMGKAGLIARIADEKDGRNKKVYLTEKGKILVGQGQSIIIAEGKKVLEGQDKEKLKMMIKIMQELTEKML